MNEFVNYGKRSVDLPDGCSDLIELLRAKAARDLSAGPRGVRIEGAATHGLASIENHVGHLFNSTGHGFVFIYSPPWVARCVLESGEQGIVMSFHLQPPTIFRAEQIRRLCGEAGLLPGIDVQKDGDHFLAFKLPATIAEATALIQRILREVYNIAEEAPLNFQIIE